ncbi:ubinuclein-1 [Leptodactylus fuscus]|uniref:ubinuclein-1 n=1 Tax=Leptodactylus fuscus TaxID=238119 RepID=UPI003F4F0FB7
MAEPRRMQLSSVSSNVPLQPSSPKKPRNDDKDLGTRVAATVRIALTLFEPNQKKCPEFVYPELLRSLQRNNKNHAEKKQLDPFNDEEAERTEVEALSKKFEAKYGKKRRRDRMQDLIDMGYGYDESDSFIDNSEAYDELVPASLNTKYGGFYINSGTLQFRQASESEDDSMKEKKKKSPKKIKERGDKVKKRKREEEKKSKKSKYSKPGFTALNGTKDKKKKKLMANLQEMLARFERDKKIFEKWTPSIPLTTTSTTAPKTTLSTPTAPALPPPPPPPREAEPAPDPLPSTIVSESKLPQAAKAMDSMIKKEPENLEIPPEKGSGSLVGEIVKEEFKKPPSTPEGLPPPLEKKMKELAKWAQTPEGEKKIKMFSPEINSSLLDIYLMSRDLSPNLRSTVFTHLSSILPCSKDMLVRWSTRLYLQKKGERLREPLRKLKEAVTKAIPEQIIKYHAELKVYNEAKYAKMLSDDKEKEPKMPSEGEEEEDKGSKKAAGPRKKFQWTEEIRQLLCQLVRMKVDLYEPDGIGMSSLEDYLKTFLDEDVKPLWPRGWMQARTLFKESRRLYPQLSSLMAKNKSITPPKVKAKDTSNKQDKNISSSPMETQGPAVTQPAPARVSSPSVMSTSEGSSVSTHAQDNSLDGDLIHNPPSLEGVSEHLTALSGRTSGLVFDFPVPSKPAGPEKVIVIEEKKKPCPPVSVAPMVTMSQSSVRPVFPKKFMATGSEKKTPSPVPSPKPSPDAQQKQKPLAQYQAGPAKPQTANLSVQPSVSLYQINNKGGFVHPIQSGGAKVSAPTPSQQPLAPQTKPPKLQGIPPSSSPSGTSHKPIGPPGFIVKHLSSPGSAGVQVYRAVNRPAAPPHGNPSGKNTVMIPNQPPSSASRNPTTMSTKKSPHPPQKLTLMAPQDSGGGTQGVAKLLTSSMVAGGGGGNAAPNINAQKGNGAPGLLGAAPLTILTSSYKQNGGKIPASASLNLLSPINTFPLRVVSFTTEPSPKPGASKDAIVTGPAPGTFNHGLPRNLLSGLHTNTGHHSSPIPHPVLSGHMQPAQTDGAHSHSKGPVPTQMRTGRPNNP